jgi:hypothetical protein
VIGNRFPERAKDRYLDGLIAELNHLAAQFLYQTKNARYQASKRSECDFQDALGNFDDVFPRDASFFLEQNRNVSRNLRYLGL